MKLPEGVRAELIEGELFMSPSPKERHQKLVGNVYVALRSFVDAKGLGQIRVAPLDVHLPSGDIVQPDVIFVAQANLSIVREWIRGVPDLLVEVLSPEGRERDRIVKRDLYARNGVREYWLVDGEAPSVEVLTLKSGVYAPHGYFEMEDAVTSSLLPGLSVPVRQVLE